MNLRKRLMQFCCPHRNLSNTITVSGYGYTEYRITFCKDCEKALIQQTKEQQ